MLSVSAVVLFGFATWLCWKAYNLRVLHAICAGFFGFFLAFTGFAPMISGLAGWLLGHLAGLVH